MCEFCLKHSEGKKWYLEAKNYSDDLLNDLGRQKMIKEFVGNLDSLTGDYEKLLESYDKAPGLIKWMIRWKTVRTMKKLHFGQIVPIEDLERILDFVNSVVRIACVCRHITRGEEKRYCYGISVGPDGGKMAEILEDVDTSFYDGPDSKGVERLTKEEALSNFREYEKEGLCHSVWTFKTPFIAGICNCDRPDCLALQTSLHHGISAMFRAEYVCENDTERCIGCRECMKVCQFGAIGYSAGEKKVFIDSRYCYGCGICRSACNTGALRLVDRASVPAAANLWEA